jgi:mannose-1-phosphate guanylyltransferase/mannose-6-phosphate isomerase
MPPLIPVVLCGGNGSRLWPLSRASLPKPYIQLLGEETLLARTLERAAHLADEVLVVASAAHRFHLRDAIARCDLTVTPLLEPEPRNTAAAMACAALHVAATDPTTLLLVLPADHVVPDAAAFAATVRRGLRAAADGWFVTFGVRPTGPSTAFGYIQVGPPLSDGVWQVARFAEKPGREAAEALLAQGGHLWNAGIFLVRADTLLDALHRHAPDILQDCRSAMALARHDQDGLWPDPELFGRVRSQSIDYAVLERHDRVAVVPFEGAWSDVGSWTTVLEHTPTDDPRGNRTVGPAWTIDCDRTYVHASQRTVVALGVSDVVVVETPDAVLIAAASEVEGVRRVVETLQREGVTVATQHRRVGKPWGSYDTLDAGTHFQVKRITVSPGGQLSLQVHERRAEHWVVVRGTARVTRGDEVITLAVNESTFLPAGMPHRLENPSDEPLELIEVQTGSYLGEDDIVRLDDAYGRDLG